MLHGSYEEVAIASHLTVSLRTPLLQEAICTAQSFVEDEGLARLAQMVQVLDSDAERSHQGAALLGSLSSSMASIMK